jgi:hypothetical protein
VMMGAILDTGTPDLPLKEQATLRLGLSDFKREGFLWRVVRTTRHTRQSMVSRSTEAE